LAFDIGALDSVDRAQPFEPATDAIVSFDGNVYVQCPPRRRPFRTTPRRARLRRKRQRQASLAGRIRQDDGRMRTTSPWRAALAP
jgi:hypothetical protein